MYNILIDTCTNCATLVLFYNDKVLEVIAEDSRRHSNHIVSMIDRLLNNHKIKARDLKGIICVNGPGSFTGIRIGVTIAKTISYALNIPIKTISLLTLKAISSDNKNICISEINGKYIGIFDENNNLKSLFYLSKEEFNNYPLKNSFVENVIIDYEKVIQYIKSTKPINCHAVKPLYVKKIEVEND